jgi:protein O-mannosyl-transferase
LGKKSRLKKDRAPGRPEITTAGDRLHHWMLALVALAAILGYLQTLSYEFVYDDQNQILRNPWIRSWTGAGRFFTSDVWAFTGAATRSNYYRPFQMLLYTGAHSLGGLQPQAFHFLNILLHTLCSLLVAAIGFRLAGSSLIGIAGGLIFALHPIHSESVAWISGVTDPLCAAFYFASLYFHLQDGGERKNPGSWLLAPAFFLGALFSKEMAFTLPVVALWMDGCLNRRPRLARYALFAAVFFFYALLRMSALHAFLVRQVPLELSAAGRILSSLVLGARYLAKMFVPFDISAAHVFQPTTTVASWSFAWSIAVLAAFSAAAWRLRNRRELLFLFGFCVLTILPVLNLNGIGENVFADRYLYIPTLGSCLIIPLAAKHLVARWPARPPWLTARTGAVMLGLLLAVFAWRLAVENAVWRDAPTFYVETTKRSPTSAVMAHNLAAYHYFAGDFERALDWETKALAAWERSFIKNPSNLAEICLALGELYRRQGKIEEAREYFGRARAAAPGYEPVLLGIGNFHIGMQEYDEALVLFEAAMQANPRNEIACNNAAGIHLVRGRFDQAIALARRALEIAPDYGDACENLARAFAAKGRKEEARRAYLELKRINPSKSAAVDAELKRLDSSR